MFSWINRLYHKLSSPLYFYEITGKWLPWLLVIGGGLLVWGVVWGLAFSPEDYQMKNSIRIMYVHVPAASLAMLLYIFMAGAGAVGQIWKIKMADMVAKSTAGIGASMTLMALVTGSLWGAPTWGTYWEWDARLTSMLLLFFLYLGILAMHNAIEDYVAAAKATTVLSLVGVVNIVIIKYSVEWWNTLHQPASITATGGSKIHESMLGPLFCCFAAFYVLSAAIVVMRARNEILVRESRSKWLKAKLLEEA